MNTSQRQTITRQQTPKNCLFLPKNPMESPIETSKSLVGGAGSKNFQKYEVIVQNDHFQSEMKLIEWRSKTELPIVKVLFYKILQKKLLSECSVVQVAIENFPTNLNTLPKMVFPQVLYLFKESLVGFERLYDRFGPFQVSNKMVLVNKNQKCRVWINENITLNFPAKRTKYTENQFLGRVIRLFEEKCVKSSLAWEMFAGVARSARLAEAIQFVENFMKNQRIIVSNRLNLTNDPTTPKKQGEHNILEEPFKVRKESFGCSTFRKIPKFILNLRDQRKLQKTLDSKSIDQLTKKRQLQRKGSFLNISNKSITPSKNKPSYSGSKSNISPKGQVSQKNIKNVKEFWKESFPKGENHHSVINTSKVPLKKLQKKASFEQGEGNTAKPTIEIKKNPRVTCIQEIDLDLQREFFKILENEPVKNECSVNSSQQTATTINESQTPPQSSTSFGEQESIFEKNGWMKRVDNLNSSNSLTKSHHEGSEQQSDSYARKGENLALLGTMGKQVRESIMQQR